MILCYTHKKREGTPVHRFKTPAICRTQDKRSYASGSPRPSRAARWRGRAPTRAARRAPAAETHARNETKNTKAATCRTYIEADERTNKQNERTNKEGP